MRHIAIHRTCEGPVSCLTCQLFPACCTVSGHLTSAGLLMTALNGHLHCSFNPPFHELVVFPEGQVCTIPGQLPCLRSCLGSQHTTHHVLGQLIMTPAVCKPVDSCCSACSLGQVIMTRAVCKSVDKCCSACSLWQPEGGRSPTWAVSAQPIMRFDVL